MKRKRPWKPGGHPRRAAGSMRINRQKAQQAIKNHLKKEAVALAEDR